MLPTDSACLFATALLMTAACGSPDDANEERGLDDVELAVPSEDEGDEEKSATRLVCTHRFRGLMRGEFHFVRLDDDISSFHACKFRGRIGGRADPWNLCVFAQNNWGVTVITDRKFGMNHGWCLEYDPACMEPWYADLTE